MELRWEAMPGRGAGNRIPPSGVSGRKDTMRMTVRCFAKLEG